MIPVKIRVLAALVVICAGCKKHSPLPTEKKYIVSTIAGDGSDACKDGPALSARFHTPIDVAVTSDGVIYVADFNDHRIREIVDGQVYTLAGSDSTGVVNDVGVMARFNNPYRVAADQAGNCYVLDQVDPRVRKITPSAYVTTYAGSSSPGFLDGASRVAQFAVNAEGIAAQVNTVAQFNYPGAVAADRQGNIYVVEEGNFRIQKIATNGVISILAGSGTAGYVDGQGDKAQFEQMEDIAADSQGNLYLIDGERIRKITPAGVVSTIAGSTAGYADGEGDKAQFNYPGGLGIDAHDNIYVADAINNRIRKISLK